MWSTFFEFHDAWSDSNYIAVHIHPQPDSGAGRMDEKLAAIGGRRLKLSCEGMSRRSWVFPADLRAAVIAVLPGRVTDITTNNHRPDWKLAETVVVTKLDCGLYGFVETGVGSITALSDIYRRHGLRYDYGFMDQCSVYMYTDNESSVNEVCKEIEALNVRVVRKVAPPRGPSWSRHRRDSQSN